MIHSLIFDFDGLIVDTESADFQSWQETFEQVGAELPMSVWLEYVGTADEFDPYSYLEAQIDRPVDWQAIRAGRLQRNMELVGQLDILPGVLDMLQAARDSGMRLAVASSSPHAWVDPLLEKLKLRPWFELVACRDDVGNIGKPDPAVYLHAMQALGVEPGRGLALEDSPHGVAAAKSAGLYCVAIPGPITRHLNFDHADLRLQSLMNIGLPALIQQVAGSHG